MTSGTLALVLAVLGLFHKELLLVSFDRATAVTFWQERDLLGCAIVIVFVDRPDGFHGCAQRRSASITNWLPRYWPVNISLRFA